MIEITITTSATTLMIGSWFGRARLAKIQIGSVWSAPDGEDGHDHLVEREPEGEQAAGEQRRPQRRERHVAERLPESAPRSDDASSNESDVRRSRAITLL